MIILILLCLWYQLFLIGDQLSYIGKILVDINSKIKDENK